ncbi:hypothetical protein EsH8_IV_001240 [Colletotrichum jinshuiense]
MEKTKEKQGEPAISYMWSGLGAVIPVEAGGPTISDFIDGTISQTTSIISYIEMLSEEPGVLEDEVVDYVLSRPEAIPDDAGSSVRVEKSKLLSSSVFDVAHGIYKDGVTWHYINFLLTILKRRGAPNDVEDHACVALILQELANVCDLKHRDKQEFFKRQVQSGIASKWFKRVPDVHDDLGNAHVVLKNHPGDFAKTNPQLHYILRLCQPGTDALEADECATKLRAIHARHPEKYRNMQLREIKALSRLTNFTWFVTDLNRIMPLPPVSHEKGQCFISRFHSLELKLESIKESFKLPGNPKTPLSLHHPDMAREAMGDLDDLIKSNLGNIIPDLYWNLMHDCLDDLTNQVQQSDMVGVIEEDEYITALLSGQNPKDLPNHEVGKQKKKKKRPKKKKKTETTTVDEQDSPSIPQADQSTHLSEVASLNQPEDQLVGPLDDFSPNAIEGDLSSPSADQRLSPPPEDNPSSSTGIESASAPPESHQSGPLESEVCHLEKSEPSSPLEDEAPSSTTLEPANSAKSSAADKSNNGEKDDEDEPSSSQRTYKVSPSAAGFFETMFERSRCRGPLAWGDFERAMVEVGFAIIHKKGSAVTFVPPPNSGLHSLTAHQPHSGTSNLEGWRTLKLAARLKRLFGWDEKTFVVT